MIALEEERTMGERRTESRQARRLRVARRSMTYVVRTLLLIILACIVCIGAFLTAERMSNLYILASEGMALRADCVIADGARNDLEEYFTLTFLDNDPAMSDTTYANYTITSYNYDLTIEKISVLPWSMTATVTAVERVTLKGNINAKGRKIFHTPGQRDYGVTVIDTAHGERWFCSAAEAIAAGWTPAAR